MTNTKHNGRWFTMNQLLPISGSVWLACISASFAMAPAQAQTATETVLHNFKNPPKGSNPSAGVIRDSAGNFYGTAENGGPANAGVVFKLSATGAQTVLHSFTGGADGRKPAAGVIRDSAGNLFGTASAGGIATGPCSSGLMPAGCGVVFKLDSSGQETVLHSFTGGADGGLPDAGVILDAEGNLYGTTYLGGARNCASGCGVVYKLDPAGQETVLYSFTGGADGGFPEAGVILDSAGNLYGTTTEGGKTDDGVVYKLDTTGQETVLHSFTIAAQGYGLSTGVVRDSAGNLYGTTYQGGAGDCDGFGCGVVYKLDTNNHETVLYSFTGGADGGMPLAGVILDSAGNLYGTTSGGGVVACGEVVPAGCGVVFKLDSSGQETVLYSFMGGSDGYFPESVVLDVAGNLYGTTVFGGPADLGTVFEVDTASQETVLYGFPGPADGNEPFAGLIRDSAGNLYGTTGYGGPANAGVVYKLDAEGQETVLYSFAGGASGSLPWAGVIRDASGNLYGTTYYGGSANAGVVYKLDTAGQETVLYNFTGGTGGGNPRSGVTRDASGNLYGTSAYAGTAGAGLVYKLDTAGNMTVLYTFTGGADGGTPIAGAIVDSAGNLYGTTANGGVGFGVVYQLDAAGQETVLYSFAGGADGASPWAGVVRDAAGNLYGTTYGGGTANSGTVYKVDPAGQETVLYSFTGGANGGSPQTGIALDSSGNVYGTTELGGTANWGQVYEVDPAGQETILYSFTDGADGGDPQAGVILDSAGNLYGTTFAGGKWSIGTVFQLTPQ